MIRPDPCFKCGARASCRHREVEDVQLPKHDYRGPGRPANANSPWGKKGNPAGTARQRILDGMKAQLQ